MNDINFTSFYLIKGRRYYAFYGCSKTKAKKVKFLENTPGFYHSMTKEASVVCCSLDGTSCSRKTVNGNCYFGTSKVSWKQAFELCKDAKMRLCDSQEELDQCCGAECGLDDKLIWSNVLEGIAQ